MYERLVRHFLQRFLDNDLISPDDHRHQTLSIVGGALAASSLFVAFLLAFQYLLGMTPGRTAVAALDDAFVFIGSSMLIAGLAALSQWDALSLDARDASILGPLPIPLRVIVCAKLTAVALLLAGVVVTLNILPVALYPWGLAGTLHVGVVGFIRLTLAHAVSTVGAGAFGFMTVLGVREVLRALLGTNGFKRVSTLVQASLVMLFSTMLLLLPGMSSGVARSWLASRTLTPYAVPPLWFIGLHEMIAGNTIDGVPRRPLRGRLLVAENEATLLYRSRHALFRPLAGVALGAFALIAVVAIAAYFWNSRRLPVPFVGRPGRRPARAIVAWIAQRSVVRDPAAQAGFFFTLQSLARSAPHRLAVAAAMAVGLAAAIVSLRGIDLRQPVDMSAIPLSLLAVQTGLITALLAGVRHVIRVPADVRANWIFHLTWSGDERPVRHGSQTCGVGRVGPASAARPLSGLLRRSRISPRPTELLMRAVDRGRMLHLLLLRVRKLPLASSYFPTDNPMLMAPTTYFSGSSS